MHDQKHATAVDGNAREISIATGEQICRSHGEASSVGEEKNAPGVTSRRCESQRPASGSVHRPRLFRMKQKEIFNECCSDMSAHQRTSNRGPGFRCNQTEAAAFNPNKQRNDEGEKKLFEREYSRHKKNKNGRLNS